MVDLRVREANADELADWDAHTVRVPGGSVYQSRAWARYQVKLGATPRFLITSDDRRVLALERRWPLVPGGEAQITRGPLIAGDELTAVADRALAVADYLAAQGIDTVTTDLEVAASTGYGQLMQSRGFHAAEEREVSRDRMSVPLPEGGTADDWLMSLSMSTRQRVRGAVKAGLVVTELAPDGDRTATVTTLNALYDILAEVSQRRGFRLVSRSRFLAWTLETMADDIGFVRTVEAPGGRMLGGALFYRNGDRLTYFLGGDVADARREFPGVIHLLIWRAIESAIEMGMRELDLGGVDVRGARRPPVEGEPMHGLLAFKESMRGQWIEQAGNYRRVMRPVRYKVGRTAQRVAGRLRRGDRAITLPEPNKLAA